MGHAIITAVASQSDRDSICWAGGYTAERCCKKNDPTCWDGIITDVEEHDSVLDSTFTVEDPELDDDARDLLGIPLN